MALLTSPLPLLPLLLLVMVFVTLTKSQCIPVVDPATGESYDLSPLAQLSRDYTCPNTMFPGYNYTINVCKSIVATDSVCTHGAGICEKSEFMSTLIGRFSERFTLISPGVLSMHYPDGPGCYSGNITFYCDEKAGFGNPVYEYEGCVFAFSWRTAYACPSGPESEACLFEVDGQRYNFLSLAGTYHMNSTTLGHVFAISPCSFIPQTESRCGAQGFGCQEYIHEPTSHLIAKYVEGPRKVENGVAMSYFGGDVCKDGTQRTFDIFYLCSDSTAPAPVFVSEDHCHYNFLWKTSLAC